MRAGEIPKPQGSSSGTNLLLVSMLFHLIFGPRRSLGTLSAEHIILLLCAELITTGLSGEDGQQLIAAGVGWASRAATTRAHTVTMVRPRTHLHSVSAAVIVLFGCSLTLTSNINTAASDTLLVCVFVYVCAYMRVCNHNTSAPCTRELGWNHSNTVV